VSVELRQTFGSNVDIVADLVSFALPPCLRPRPCRLDTEVFPKKPLGVNQQVVINIIEFYVTLLTDICLRVKEPSEKRRRALRTVLDVFPDPFEVNWLLSSS